MAPSVLPPIGRNIVASGLIPKDAWASFPVHLLIHYERMHNNINTTACSGCFYLHGSAYTRGRLDSRQNKEQNKIGHNGTGAQ